MTKFDVAIAYFDFADELGLFSSRVLQYRIRNKVILSGDDFGKLLDLELQLDKATATVREKGIESLDELTSLQKKDIVAATV